MNKSVRTADLFDCGISYLMPLFEGKEYPWMILPEIKNHVRRLLETGIEGYRLFAPGVLLGEGVHIHPSAVIDGPCVIGAGTEVRPGAFLRGCIITGEDCVIGNSTELKNCILLNGVQVPHYNYVGDSILGNKAHMGAGAVCSNLKGDGKDVVIHGESDHQTGLRKVGGFLGDCADIGCGSVVNPGTVVGKNTRVYPLTSLRGVYPSDSIVKSSTEIAKRL